MGSWLHAPGCPRGRPRGPPRGPRTLTVLLRSACRPSLSVSSLTAMALGMSCLLANTSSTASRSSSSCSCGVVGAAEPGTGPGGLWILCPPLPRVPPSLPVGLGDRRASSPASLHPVASTGSLQRGKPQGFCSIGGIGVPTAGGSRALRPRRARTGWSRVTEGTALLPNKHHCCERARVRAARCWDFPNKSRAKICLKQNGALRMMGSSRGAPGCPPTPLPGCCVPSSLFPPQGCSVPRETRSVRSLPP